MRPFLTLTASAVAYRKFPGRDARVEALLRDRGFPVPGEDEEPGVGGQ